jgi:hypothetical protein
MEVAEFEGDHELDDEEKEIAAGLPSLPKVAFKVQRADSVWFFLLIRW